MSRIEEALENANRQRDTSPQPETAPAIGLPQFEETQSYDVAGSKNPCLVMLNGNNSPEKEEYKKLKSMVVKLTGGSAAKNTIVVTSAARNEGKSIVSLNLAITLAQEYDHTVLLVDADLRKPSIHRYLGLSPKIGLTECLQNGTDIGKALIRTGIGKMVVLPAGKGSSSPVELMSSNKMRELIKEIKHRYADRYVIIDTPPILPFAEVHALAASVDGVLFVIREGQAPMSSIKGALDLLKDSNILGSVYNCAEMNRFNGYQYYYGYQDYYA